MPLSPPSPRTVPTRPKQRRSGRPAQDSLAQRRSELLDAALAEFIATGFQAATIEGIARRAGVSKATIYRHYTDKQELLKEVALHGIGDMHRELLRLVDDTRPHQDVLRDFAYWCYDHWFVHNNIELYRIMICEAPRLPGMGALMFDMSGRMGFDPLIGFLDQLVARGVLAIPDTRQAAAEFITLVTGGVRFLMLPMQPSHEDRERRAHDAVNLFLHGYQREPG
jgi:AcrR family transcriptional regulator